MWTAITRPKYDRTGLRYASDLSDAEWRGIEPHLPPPKAVGRPRTTDLREVVNAILYVLRSGCPWRLLPKDFPPRSTVQRYFAAWRDDDLWARINHHLLMATREAEGREASPSAGVIDSQSDRACRLKLEAPSFQLHCHDAELRSHTTKSRAPLRKPGNRLFLVLRRKPPPRPSHHLVPAGWYPIYRLVLDSGLTGRRLP